MLKEIKNIKSERRDLRNFGFIIGIIFLIIGGFLFWKEKEVFQIFIAISIIFILTAFTLQSVLKPVYWIWMIFGIILSWFMTLIILSLLFYVVVTSIGLTLRFFGKQFLELRWDKSKDSYWNYKIKKQYKKTDYERQF